MFKCKFETQNAAFDDAPNVETARALREIATQLVNGWPLEGGRIWDTNGNTIGSWKFDPAA